MRPAFRHLLLALALMPLGVCADLIYYLNWTPTDLNNNADFEKALAVVLYAMRDDSITQLASLTRSVGTAAWSENDLADGMVWSDLYISTPIDELYADPAYSFFVNAYTDESTFTTDTLLFDGMASEAGNLITYEKLQADFGAISNFVVDPNTTSYWTPNLSGSAPEPSSGLLLLVGGALFALRRRRPGGADAQSQERRI